MGAFVQSAGFTLLSFALVISVVVFFHELGHLLVGKWVGVKAVRFSIGFGPKLVSVQRGETEYRVSLLPLGGYVKFAGDNPYEEIAPEDRGRAFLEQPPWKRGLIAFAGPAANLILAVALYFIVFAAPHQELAAQVGYVKPQSPAAQAGLRYGDRIVAIDGEPVDGWSALQEQIRAHAGQPLQLQILRDGRPESLRIVQAWRVRHRSERRDAVCRPARQRRRPGRPQARRPRPRRQRHPRALLGRRSRRSPQGGRHPAGPDDGAPRRKADHRLRHAAPAQGSRRDRR